MPPALSFADDEGSGREERSAAPPRGRGRSRSDCHRRSLVGLRGARVEPKASDPGNVETKATIRNVEAEASACGDLEAPVEGRVGPGRRPSRGARRTRRGRGRWPAPASHGPVRPPARPRGLGREDVPLRRWVTHALLLWSAPGPRATCARRARRQAASPRPGARGASPGSPGPAASPRPGPAPTSCSTRSTRSAPSCASIAPRRPARHW